MITNEYILLPAIGFLLGWFTNYIAIKFLFHPKKKILGIQGLIPRRRDQLALKVSEASINIMPHEIQLLLSIPKVGEKITNYLKTGIEKKISSLSLDELENIVHHVAKKELRFIEISGGVIGLIIGLLEAIIINLI